MFKIIWSLSLAMYQSQPLLTNIVRYQRHDDQENEPMSMLTNIDDLGKETIIAGLSLEFRTRGC
jgi:hypothetical protein